MVFGTHTCCKQTCVCVCVQGPECFSVCWDWSVSLCVVTFCLSFIHPELGVDSSQAEASCSQPRCSAETCADLVHVAQGWDLGEGPLTSLLFALGGFQSLWERLVGGVV